MDYLKELSKKEFTISHKLFEQALAKIHKGTSEDLKRYRGINEKFKDGEVSTFIQSKQNEEIYNDINIE